MPRSIIVGMAALDIARGGDTLITLGLGSCVGVTLFDPKLAIGGMAHIMLPSSKMAQSVGNRAKFADTGLQDLYQKMIAAGARAGLLEAKMAGGAHMFSSVMQNDVIKVGSRNAQACKDILQQMRIPLRSQDTGGTYGRTIELNTQTGALSIKTIGHGVQIV